MRISTCEFGAGKDEGAVERLTHLRCNVLFPLGRHPSSLPSNYLFTLFPPLNDLQINPLPTPQRTS